MVTEENRTGLYIAMPVYFFGLILATYWAYRRTQFQQQGGDLLSAHYLGGRELGPLLTAGTLFASLFSGYTFVGIPNEAYRTGWKALRWIPALIAVVTGYFGTGLRLYKTSHLRNHNTPTDFITDRFQSQILRYTVFMLQFLPSLMYLSAQVLAIKGTFNEIFELRDATMYPVMIIMVFIVIFEWMGGLNCVAITDCIQATVMIASFLAIPTVTLRNFGGWSDLDPETYPKPEFYQTLTKDSQWGFWQFSISTFSFFLLPHLMQRTYAAKDLKSLKVGYIVMCIGPWLTCFVGVFLGTVGVQMLADRKGQPTEHGNPFAAVLEKLMEMGGFARVVAVVAVTASLAAIMSTADSLIIATSHLVTEEIVYPNNPEASKAEIHIYGKIVSLVSVSIALGVGATWDQGISDLGAIQFALSTQAVPAFLFGLFSYNRFTEMHPYSVAAAAISGSIVVVGVYFGYIKDNDDALPFAATFQGLVAQAGVLLISETYFRTTASGLDFEQKLDKGESPVLLFPDRPAWDIPKTTRFGSHALTPQFMWWQMEGMNEALANPWWACTMFLLLCFCTIVTPENMPPLSDTDSDSVFVVPPSVVNGLPWWAFSTIVHSGVFTFFLLCAICKMPTDFGDETTGHDSVSE